MPGVPWVKLWVGVFDDEKIKIIQNMPEGNEIILCWLRLLCLAGKCGRGGVVLVGENIPYTPEMLSSVWGISVPTVNLALCTLSQLNMIQVTKDGQLLITHWDDYQDVRSYEDVKEGWKIAKRKQRDKPVLGQSQDVLAQEQEERIRIRIKKEDKKRKYAEFVRMTEVEHGKLEGQYGVTKTQEMIDVLDNYKGSKDKKYKSDYRAILSWVVKKCGAVKSQQYVPTKVDKAAVKFHEDLGVELANLRKKVR